MQRWRKAASLVRRLLLNGSKPGKRDNWGPSVQQFSSGVAESIKVSETGGSKPPSQLARRGGALALFLATGLVSYNICDDLVIYDRCSSKAMETASQDPRLKEILGDEIQRGPWHWYEASLAVAHEGQSASCSFPVSGSHGTGSLHLKAVRFNGRRDSFLPRMMDGGHWEVLMLEALIPSSSGGENSVPRLQRINLMQTNDELKPGDLIGGEGSQCISSSLQEV
ncbi:unnamed protein product [Calypogeia fissa]